MTDSENSIPQDESDEDIYDDFPEFNFEDELAKLEGNKESYKQEAQDLGNRVKQLSKEVEELKKLNEVLKKNLSTLLKTAQAEVQRKDSVISELREKVESFTFRRKTKSTKDKYTTTDDLVIDLKNNLKNKSENRSRSKSRNESERERKSTQRDSRKSEICGEKEDDGFCDKNRRLGYFEDSKFKSRYSDDSYNFREKYKGNRWRFRESVPDSRSFRHNHRDHLKYDPPDKKGHSDDSRYRDKSRESKRENRAERGRQKSKRSKSRSKDRSVEKPKAVEKEAKTKPSEKSQRISLEKRKDGAKTDRKSSKEKTKSEKTSLDIFNSKSPLESLYGEPSPQREARPIVETPVTTSELEEGECTESDTKQTEPEDWKLSFKNERTAPNAPMTLYSKRMLQRLQKEQKNIEKPKVEDKKPNSEALEETPKSSKMEKEPGELTDDENIVESSKEFQEIAKVASIENSNSDKSPEDAIVFKEPLQKESKKYKESGKSEVVESLCIETAKEIGDVVEFSPFKNNYKLIEISPIKAPTERRASLKARSKNESQKEVENSILNLLSSLVPQEKNEEARIEQLVEETSKITPEEESQKTELKDVKEPQKELQEERNLGKGKRKGGAQKRKRKESENGPSETKKWKEDKRSTDVAISISKPDTPVEKVKEDISSFEFFKPITEKPAEVGADYKMTMSVTGVVCLETPNKRGEKFKNLMINEQMIVVDSRSGPFTPIISSKCVEMTPRRMLKNDLMLTDSEDESVKPDTTGEAEEEEAEESEVDSDSGASDFVDLL